MNPPSKGRSPFFPGQPVPFELFAGRTEQIKHILERGVGQVANGKPITMFVQGEYGIGKSSIAGFVQHFAELAFGLHSIYAPLSGAVTLDEVGSTILEATLRSGALNPTRSEKIRQWLSTYIGEQTLFGFTIHAEKLKNDAPSITKGLLPFFHEIMKRLSDTGVKGIFLVLDEINGITRSPDFAHFIKGIVDTNAMSKDRPVPLLLMLCGVEERRREMIRNHQPIDRIFDVIEIKVMSQSEMEEFFNKAFNSVQMLVKREAMQLMIEHSAGFPKIMHLIGDAAYWLDQDGIIDRNDAVNAIIQAADEVGKKYVDQQIYRALRSKVYHSILRKIALLKPESMSFMKKDIESNLSSQEKSKFHNFLQKMKNLKVLRSGDVKGEYIFNSRMVQLYIWLQSLEKLR